MAASLHAVPGGNPHQILATVWQRNLPVVRQRLTVLREAAAMSQAGPLSTPARIEAASIAHKLAGSLGMFGYPKGSEIARHLEAMLDGDSDLPAALFAHLTRELEQILSL